MLYKIKKNEINIFILFVILLLSGCGTSEGSIQNGDYNISMKEPKEKEISEIIHESELAE